MLGFQTDGDLSQVRSKARFLRAFQEETGAPISAAALAYSQKVGPMTSTRLPGETNASAASQISSEAPLPGRMRSGETPSDSASVAVSFRQSRSGY